MNSYPKEVIQPILRQKESNKNGDKNNEVTVRNDTDQELIITFGHRSNDRAITTRDCPLVVASGQV